MAYDMRIRGIELLVPLAKIVKAGPDGGCKRPVSFMLGHLLPTCLQPFECAHCLGDGRFGFTREIMLCVGDFLLHVGIEGLISQQHDNGTHTHLQDLMEQLQSHPFRIRKLELRVLAAIREFGDTVAFIREIDEVLNSLEQTVTSTRWEKSHLRIPAAVEGVARSCCLLMTIVCDTT